MNNKSYYAFLTQE